MSQPVRLRNVLLISLLLITACAVPISRRLTFQQTIDSFFAPDNPDIVLLRQSRRDFGGDEFVIIAWHEPNLIRRVGEREVPELTDEASARIVKLTEALNQVSGIDPDGTRSLHRYLDGSPRSRNTRNGMIELFEETLISRDRDTTAVILQLLPADSSPVPRSETTAEIRRIVSEFNADAVVAGEPVMIQEMFDLVERDGRILYFVSLIVLTAVLLLIFRGLRWAVAAVGVVMASVACTRAAFVITGVQLSMVSSVLNSLLTIIAIATAMHVTVHYRELRLSHEPSEAAVLTLRAMWQPVLWTGITTAIGFGALLISDIVPVRSFATMMVTGVFITLCCLALVIPAALASGRQIRRPGHAPLESLLDGALTALARMLERRPLITCCVCGALMAITAPGLLQLTIDSDFSHNFRESSQIIRALEFVETHLGPAGTWEVAFDAPEELPEEFLDRTGALTKKLHELDGVTAELLVLSLDDAVDIPPRFGSPVTRLDRLERRHPDLIDNFYNPGARRMRIVLRSPEQQPSETKLQQIESVRSLVDEHFAEFRRERPELAPSHHAASGLYVLLARIVESLLRDQLNSFLLATAGILLCMTTAFRSLRIGLISLLPNVFPVVVVLGSLGLLQIPINMGTAMMASVSMGLTVDSTIHYITAFERARRTHTVSEALHIAHAGAGRAVVFAHLALIAGFLVLTVSMLVPLIWFGALLSLSMFSGLIGDLVLLPLLLRWTTPATAELPAADAVSTAAD